MTKKEAIEQLNFMIKIMPKEPPAECDSIEEWFNTDKDIRNALEMAIKALEQAPKESKDIHLPLYNVGDRIEPGTDGNAYKLYMSNGKEFEKQPCKDAGSVNGEWIPLYFREKPRGKWVKVTNGRGGHECNICHDYAPSFQNGDEYLTKYCPKCGAEMEVEE